MQRMKKGCLTCSVRTAQLRYQRQKHYKHDNHRLTFFKRPKTPQQHISKSNQVIYNQAGIIAKLQNWINVRKLINVVYQYNRIREELYSHFRTCRKKAFDKIHYHLQKIEGNFLSLTDGIYKKLIASI